MDQDNTRIELNSSRILFYCFLFKRSIRKNPQYLGSKLARVIRSERELSLQHLHDGKCIPFFLIMSADHRMLQ